MLPLKDAMDAPGSGELAMEALTTHLLKVDAYEIIERGALEQIAKEQKLGATGAIDAETAAQIGKLVGADALIIGAVTEYQPRNFMIFPPAKATVTCRMVRTDTATVEWTATYTLGWHPVKWMASFFWPLGVFFVVTSPSAENRLNKAVGKISKQVAKKSREH
ncbi:MAG: hypothetical protein HYY63_07090 [Elusimicrobia bacterium]|nr:hypothetical protein [Elusimicrobiota bacterium]